MPLWVEVGKTLPQGATEQVTVQVTPALAPSLLTCAEKSAAPPT